MDSSPATMPSEGDGLQQAENAQRRSGGGAGEEPANALFSRLLDDSVALVKNEIALAKAELRESIGDFKMGLGSLAMAAVVLLAGVFTMVAAAVIALATMIEWWLAALIVGMALAAVGVGSMYTARRKLTGPGANMARTQESLTKTRPWSRGADDECNDAVRRTRRKY